MRRTAQAFVGGLIGLADPVSGHAQCVGPAAVSPSDVVIADARPRVTWSPTPGATGYALSMQSRVAEGRLIASYDVALATNEFVPPAPLTDDKATVTVSITPRCTDAAGAPRSASFRIDVTPTCPTPRATWDAVSGATHYEVKAHAPLDGKQVAAAEVREPRAELPAPFVGGTVVSVRPRCAAAYGEAAFAVAAPR